MKHLNVRRPKQPGGTFRKCTFCIWNLGWRVLECRDSFSEWGCFLAVLPATARLDNDHDYMIIVINMVMVLVIADCWLLPRCQSIPQVATLDLTMLRKVLPVQTQGNKNTIHIIWSCISWWHSSFTLNIQIYRYRMIDTLYININFHLSIQGIDAVLPFQPLKHFGGSLRRSSEPSQGPRVQRPKHPASHRPWWNSSSTQVRSQVRSPPRWHPAAKCPAQSFTMAFGTPGGISAFGCWMGPPEIGNDDATNFSLKLPWKIRIFGSLDPQHTKSNS